MATLRAKGYPTLFVRVMGPTIAAFWSAVFALTWWGGGEARGAPALDFVTWLIVLAGVTWLVFLAIRPFMTWCRFGEDRVVVRSWFRTYAFSAGDVAAVTMASYTGLVGFAVGWLPFVGQIRMLEIERIDGREVSLWVTVNRYRHCLLLQHAFADALGVERI